MYLKLGSTKHGEGLNILTWKLLLKWQKIWSFSMVDKSKVKIKLD